MLLNELTTTRNSKLKKATKMLESVYNTKFNTTGDLSHFRAMEQSAHKIVEALKEKRLEINDPSVQKYVLIREASNIKAQEINEARKEKLDENYRTSDKYNNYVEKLAEFANNCIESGEDYDAVMETILDEYRKTNKEYPDTEFEQDLKAYVMSL